MRRMLGLRAAVALFLAVLMPLEVGQCVFLMPLRADASEVARPAPADGGHDCCERSAPASSDPAPAATCCAYTPLPAAIAGGSGWLPAPADAGGSPALPATAAMPDPGPAARAGAHAARGHRAPLGPGADAAAPRAPPHSA